MASLRIAYFRPCILPLRHNKAPRLVVIIEDLRNVGPDESGNSNYANKGALVDVIRCQCVFLARRPRFFDRWYRLYELLVSHAALGTTFVASMLASKQRVNIYSPIKTI